MEKELVVAPQIVIYKNIFKNSAGLIKELEVDKENSNFSTWKQWYNQGYRKEASFNKNKAKGGVESNYLSEIVDNINYIKKDYFSKFSANNGIWPNFIKNWDLLTKENEIYYIDYFKYDYRSYQDSNLNYAMEYHVDDFLLNNANGMRHVATINFYLNNNYNGGEICAYDSSSGKSYKYKPSPGDAVVMPSTEPFYHAVKNFDGDRYFLRSFVDYHVDGSGDWQNLLKKQEEYILNDMQIVKIQSVEEEIS